MTNPNHVTTPQPELTDAEKAVFSLDTLNEWRTKQFGILAQLRANSGFSTDQGYVQEFDNSIESTLDDFLASKGIDNSSANYDEVRALFREASVDNFTEDEWGNSPVSRRVAGSSDTQSESDKFAERISARLETPEATELETDLSDAEWDEIKSEYNEYLSKYAEMLADRSKSMVERAKTREDINKLKEEATGYVSGLATKLMNDMEADGKTEQEIAAGVEAFVNEQMDSLMQAMEQHRQDEYEQSSVFMKRIYDTWAKWTTQSTNEEGKTKFFSKGRAKKLLATAAPAALVVGAVGAFAPVAIAGGTVAAVAGGATLAFRSIGRKLAGGFLDRKSTDKKLAAAQTEDMKRAYEASIAESEVAQRKTIFEVADEYSEHYRKRNLRRTLAGVAVAGTVGLVSGTAAEYASGRLEEADFGRAVDWVKDKFGSNGASEDGPNVNDPTPDAPAQGPVVPDVDTDNDGVPNAQDSAPNNPDIPGDSQGGPDWSEVSHDARWIEHGEGGFQTLQELGVPQEKWEEIWADAGEQFQAEGKTYVMDDGRFGWSEPGRLTNDDLSTLVEAAQRHGELTSFDLAA